MNLPSDPIIVVGMHRSGTSLVTRILEHLGIYFGWIQDANSEATFFLKRNDAILAACGGSWEQPDCVDGLICSASARIELVEQLRADLDSFRFRSFLGPLGRPRQMGRTGCSFRWGWKDPRNSILLPIWLDLYPHARIIHVVRNGIDVAASLSKRAAQTTQNSPSCGDHSLDSSVEGKQHAWKRKVRLDRLIEWYEYLWKRAGPLGRYGICGVPRTIRTEEGFALWHKYVSRAEEGMQEATAPTMTLRFEDLVASPDKFINGLAEFSGVAAAPSAFEACRAMINPQRAFAFREHETSRELFELARQSEQYLRYYPDSTGFSAH